MVESLQTITHSRPSTRPTPVMRPAPWMACHRDHCCKRRQFENGEPGSSSCMSVGAAAACAREMAFKRARGSASAARRRFTVIDQRAHPRCVGAEFVEFGSIFDSIGKRFPCPALYAVRACE